MVLKYVYKSSIYQVSIKSIEKLESGFKFSIRKRLDISINDYLIYLGFNVERCRICNIGDVPIVLDISIIEGFVKVNGFKYKKSIYCYSSNNKCDGIKMNSNSFEFISKVENISIEEANILLKERNRSPFYKENWDSDKEYKNSQSRNMEYFTKKYGENGDVKYKEYIDKLAYSNSVERYIDEFGEVKGEEMFNIISNKKDSMSFDFFLNKNDNDKELALVDYNERLKHVNNSLDNWIFKYGYDKAIEKHKLRANNQRETFAKNPNINEIHKSMGITISNLYNKYGDYDLAVNKYKDWLSKVTVPFSRASKESLLIFTDVIKWCIDNKIEHNDIYIGDKDKNEYFIRDGKNIFFYDFTIRSKQIIIEYNGVIFHPKNEDSKWVNPFNRSITPSEAYNKQKNKINLAKTNGFSILEVWSDGDNNYDKCINFIKKNI